MSGCQGDGSIDNHADLCYNSMKEMWDNGESSKKKVRKRVLSRNYERDRQNIFEDNEDRYRFLDSCPKNYEFYDRKLNLQKKGHTPSLFKYTAVHSDVYII